MKKFIVTIALVLPLIATAENTIALDANAPLVYVNKNIGFDVKNYKYKQKEFPCDLDKVLVSELVESSKNQGIRLEPVGTIDKIQNGVIPVLAMDVEELVLGSEKRQFGTKSKTGLPKVKITAALFKNKNDFVTAKHTCAIMTLNEFTPSTNVVDLGSTTTVCGAMRRCLHDLSKDVVEWYSPLVKK